MKSTIFGKRMQDQLVSIRESLDKHDVKKAEVSIAKLLRLNLEPKQRAEVLVERARARLLNARPEDALADLQEVRILNPDETSPLTLELLGDCYFARFEIATVGFADRGDTTQAEAFYRELIARSPDYENLGWVYYQLGRVLATRMSVNEANTCFQLALLCSSHISALTAFCYERLGFVAFYELRDLAKALTFLNKASDTYPNKESRAWLVQVHLLRSRVLREMRNFDLAFKAADAAITIALDSGAESKMGLSEALLTAGELVSEIGDHEKDVIRYLQQFLQVTKRPLGVDVTWARVYEMLGDAYLRLGQYDAAVAAYQSVLQYNPDYPWEVSLYYRMARGFYQQQAFDKAVEAIQRMLRAAEAEGQAINDYRVFDVLGNAQFALRHYDKAVEAYLEALRIAPSNAEELDKIRKYCQFAQELSL
jgi:tetratricopeptide (TPR) repeat protein